MKKLFKFVGSIAAIGAAVIGGVAVYKKFFAPQDDFDDLDEDLEETFEDESEEGTRGYVSLSSVEEKAEDAAEDIKDAAEEIAETVADAAEEVKEDVTE